MKIRKNDEVIITLGKDKGKKGKVERILPKKNTVVVAGINVFKRHKKSQGQGDKGGIIEIIKPIAVSKVQVMCPKCKLATRIGYEIQGTEKNRICKKCKQVI